MEATTLALLVLIPLLVWRIYFRLKGLLGARRQSRPWRHLAPALLWPLLIAAAAWPVRSDLLALSCLGAGALGGGWLGHWATRLTRFENTPQGWFYTPPLRLGMAVTMLCVARLLYRGLELYIDSRAEMPAPATIAADDFGRSPLTLLGFGLLAAYYAAYGYGMLRWRRTQLPPSDRLCD